MKQMMLGFVFAIVYFGGLYIMGCAEEKNVRYEQTDHGCRDKMTGQWVNKELCS